MGLLETLQDGLAVLESREEKKRHGALGMNQAGNIIILIVIGIIIIAILPPLILYAIPQAKLLFQIMAIFLIYSIVRGYLGSGVLTIIITAVLIYFLVFKYTYIFASLYVLQLLMYIGFVSVIIWGVGTVFRKH